MLRRLASSALFLSFVLQGARAGAAPSASELSAARDLFREAELDEQRGNFDAALQKMQRVGRVKMTPGVRVHIAFAEEKLGRLVAALDDYSAAEREAEDDPTDKREEILRTIRAPLQRLRAVVPQLRIDIDAAHAPTGLRVSLDESPVDAALFNVPMRISVGEHRVSAVAAGYAPFAATLSASEASSHRVEITLAKASADSESAPSSHGTAAQDWTSTNGARSRPPTLLAAGGAVVLLGGGIVSFVAAGNTAQSERERCAMLPSCDPEKTTIRALDSLAIGGVVGGAALATLAVYWWMQPAPASKRAFVVTPFGAAGNF